MHRMAHPFFVAVIAAVALLASNAASAQHRWHGPRVGVYIGGPVWWGPSWYYPPPYYYYPPPVVVAPASPPVYVERPVEPAPAPAPAQSSWYYCRDPEGYYPYVRECRRAWEPVAPRPAQ